MKKNYSIRGMHCRSCEILLEREISKIPGVKHVEVDHKRGVAEVKFSHGAAPDDLIAKAVNDAGYTLGEARRLPWLSRDGEEWFELALGMCFLFLAGLIVAATGLLKAFDATFSSTPTYAAVLVIGLTAGISTCMAVVGGLVAGFSAAYAETHQYATRFERFKPNLFFGAGRLISYAVLGGAIGALGGAVKISAGMTGVLMVGAGLVMLMMGLKLTGISPKLSNMSFALPKRLGRLFGTRKDGETYSHQGAFLGGALTFFLPCGFTQAMQLYAITTGSFVSGATVMFLFALGTAPGLLGIGGLAAALKGKTARIFFRFVGLAVLLLGFFNISNGFAAGGWQFALPASNAGAPASAVAELQNGEQIARMDQLAGGYQPNAFTVRKGVPVKWIITSKSAYTCAASIRMPAYGIGTFLNAGENIIRFTPTETGAVRFTCGMGMYSGTFNVVE